MRMQDKRYESVISAADWLINTLGERGIVPGESEEFWEARVVKSAQELIQIAAEESYIVKAARVFVRAADYDLYTGDVRNLLAEIARAGAPPYEVGTSTPTENDWVVPLRAELNQRNR